jgi:D-alanyl-lipoteichoic acid acyltransferase DltB (MBOAT superfamily)
VLFNSVDFFVFFAVIATQYFRAPLLLRWPLALLGIAFPILRTPTSPEAVVAAVFSATVLAIVALLRQRDNELTAGKVLITAASLLFYSAWRWPFTGLLLLSTFLDYHCARAIHRATASRTRRFFLLVSLLGNLGVLCFFKYTNFFLEALGDALGLTGHPIELGPLPIILPLGISFYTFQTLSYTIDVYRGELEPRRSILDVALFVSFFPQLVAGPIVRASTFLPQLDAEKSWDPDRAKSGLLLMIWGLAKKLLVADALAPIVNQVYGSPELYSGWALLVATYCFAFQIYCDFSGYSDVAIGAARVLGFEILLNFQRPYFATNITTFWRRWHISLSTWLRDYLYIPLGGNRLGTLRTYGNLMATMVLGGLWHGASYNFVIWGAIHGVALAVHKWVLSLTGRRKAKEARRPLPWLVQTLVTFHLICVTWVFFRAETLEKALTILHRIAQGAAGMGTHTLFPMVLVPLLLAADALQARTEVIAHLVRHPRLSRFAIYAGVLLMIGLVTTSRPVDFIYFVF